MGGATLIGADVFGRRQLTSRVDLEIAVGARAGPSSTAAVHGRVRAVAAGAGVDFSAIAVFAVRPIRPFYAP